MPRNPSVSNFFDDVKVCNGFYPVFLSLGQTLLRTSFFTIFSEDDRHISLSFPDLSLFFGVHTVILFLILYGTARQRHGVTGGLELVWLLVDPDDQTRIHLVAEQAEVRLVQLVERPHLHLVQQAVVGRPGQAVRTYNSYFD
jgi:hypothetical protein